MEKDKAEDAMESILGEIEGLAFRELSREIRAAQTDLTDIGEKLSSKQFQVFSVAMGVICFGGNLGIINKKESKDIAKFMSLIFNFFASDEAKEALPLLLTDD